MEILQQKIEELNLIIKNREQSIKRYKDEKKQNKKVIIKKTQEELTRLKQINTAHKEEILNLGRKIKEQNKKIIELEKHAKVMRDNARAISPCFVNALNELSATVEENETLKETIQKLKRLYGQSLKRNDDLKVEHTLLEKMINDIKDKTSGFKIYVSCALEFEKGDEFYSYTRFCEDHQHTIEPVVVLRSAHFHDILNEREILRKKQKTQDIREENLKRLNHKHKQTIQGQTNKYKKETNKLNEKLHRELNEWKTKYYQTQQKYVKFKSSFAETLNQEKENTAKLIETYEQYYENIQVLADYQVLDDYINNLCYERTGKSRNYQAMPPVYNNIYTLKQIKGIKAHIRDTFNMELSEFVDRFLFLKKTRNNIAHPECTQADIADILTRTTPDIDGV